MLDKLTAQAKTIDDKSPEGIKDIHKALIEDLEHYVTTRQSSFPIPSWFLKLLAALVPWFLLALIIRFASSSDGTRSALGGILVVAIPVAFIGAILPDLKPTWINYIAYPTFAVVVIVVPLTLLQKRTTKPSKQVIEQTEVTDNTSSAPHV